MPSLPDGGGGRPAAPKKPRRAKPSLIAVDAAAPTAADTRFARALASPDPATRSRALDALGAWLGARAPGGVPRGDVLKLWAGLFYAFWHSDLAPVQNDLAQRMADIVGSVHPKTAALYLDGCFTTLQREWGGIDRLRLDKFMMCVRRFLRAAFAVAASLGAAPKHAARLLAPVSSALLPDAGGGGVAQGGLGLQIADAAAAELAAVAEAGGALRDAAPLVAPFVAALAGTPRPELAARLARSFFDPLADALARGDGGPYGRWAPAALARRVGAAAAAAAAAPGTRARNRGLLFEVVEALEAAAAAAEGGGEPASPPPAVAAEAPAAADPPRKAKKAKKRAAEEAAAPVAVAAAPATPPSAPRKAAKAAAAPAAAASAPPAAEPPAAARPATKKRVQWALKANLVHAAGGPVPPPTVRTPPGSQPRGSALKQGARAPAAGAGGGGGRKAHKRGRP